MKNRIYFAALVALAFSTIVSIFAFTGVDSTLDRFFLGYTIGDTAEDFSLKNIDENRASLSAFKEAKGVILIFTCNSCPVSVANEDRIIALDKKYKSRGFPVIAINPNNPEASPGDSYEKMKVRAREKGFTFPYLLDEGQAVYPKYGASSTPHVFVLQKENEDFIVRYIGSIDNSARSPQEVTERYVENAVDALLEGKDVDPAKTRAIGCSIKN